MSRNHLSTARMQPPHAAHALNCWMEKAAHHATVCAGSSWAFVLAVLVTVSWAVTGPFYRYSDTWQLVMNTFTTIVTFLMVFLLQRSQNKESLAMQIKLNELLASVQGASNRLINVEELSEDEVRDLHMRYQQLAQKLEECVDCTEQASIEQTMKTQEAAAR